MALNLIQVASAGAVGLASAMLEPPTLAPLVLGGQTVSYGFIAEGVGLVGGVAMQFLSPYTAPSIIDGVVDGSVALLARRITGMVKAGVPAAAPYRAAPAATRANANARGLNASGVQSDKFQFV